jgi:hypothetical protein
MPGIFDLPLRNPIRHALHMHELGILDQYNLYDDLLPGRRIDLACEAIERLMREQLGCCFQSKPNEVDVLAAHVYEVAEKLASSTAEHVAHDKNQAESEAALMDTLLSQFDSELTCVQDGDYELVEVINTVAALSSAHREAHQALIEEQALMKDDIARHHRTVKGLATSLENLPDLLQSNREKQALRVENERLRLENSGYASRVETLLGVSKDKKIENEQLKAKVHALEEKVSGYASRMNSVLAFAKEKQTENDALRRQTTDDTVQAHANPTLKFF